MTDATVPRAGGVRRLAGGWRLVRRQPLVAVGLSLLILLALVAIAAPWLATHDPLTIDPRARLRPPSDEHWFGTDNLGRDVYSRVLYGARVSLIVGLSVAVFSTIIGAAIGLVAGFSRKLDGPIMRAMDALMAIPGILLAIALMALFKPGILTVIVAITAAEIPRTTRLVRSVTLSLRELPFIEAATAIGTPFIKVLTRHILPNAAAPLIVQATYTCASAIIIEAILSFLGAGVPPDVPSWGAILSDGRLVILVAYWILLFPGIFLTLTVLSVNLLGDGLRDSLDPRLKRAVR